jgi:hypothetical protein
MFRKFAFIAALAASGSVFAQTTVERKPSRPAQ